MNLTVSFTVRYDEVVQFTKGHKYQSDENNDSNEGPRSRSPGFQPAPWKTDNDWDCCIAIQYVQRQDRHGYGERIATSAVQLFMRGS